MWRPNRPLLLASTIITKEGDYLYRPANFANGLNLNFDFNLAINFSLGFRANLIILNLIHLALWFTAAVEELATLEGLDKVIEKATASSYRPATTKINKYIDYYIDDRKVSIDYKFTSHKPANLGTSEEKN